MVAQSEGEGGIQYSNCAKCFDGFAAHVLWTVLIKSEFLVLKRKFGGLSSFSIGRQRSVCGLNALDVFFGLWVRGGVAKYLAPCRTHDLGLIRPMLLMEQ